MKPVVDNPPAFAGKTPSKSWFYGNANVYRELPSEKTHIAYRGPLFAPIYSRYDIRVEGVRMPATVIVPVKPAPGKFGNIVDVDSVDSVDGRNGTSESRS